MQPATTGLLELKGWERRVAQHRLLTREWEILALLLRRVMEWVAVRMEGEVTLVGVATPLAMQVLGLEILAVKKPVG